MHTEIALFWGPCVVNAPHATFNRIEWTASVFFVIHFSMFPRRQTAPLKSALGVILILMPVFPLVSAVVFGPATSYVVGTNPVSVAVANVDGSGPVDLIVGTQYSDAIYALLDIGSGAFSVATNTSVTNGAGSPVSLAVADF